MRRRSGRAVAALCVTTRWATVPGRRSVIGRSPVGAAMRRVFESAPRHVDHQVVRLGSASGRPLRREAQGSGTARSGRVRRRDRLRRRVRTAHALSRSALVRSPPSANACAASIAARGRRSSGCSRSKIANAGRARHRVAGDLSEFGPAEFDGRGVISHGVILLYTCRRLNDTPVSRSPYGRRAAERAAALITQPPWDQRR
jgi:hypothetical protein